MATLSELLHAASRTFAIGIDLLPEPLHQQIKISYLLLRVSDFLEDNEIMSPAEKVERLHDWNEVLHGQAGTDLVYGRMRADEEDTPDALVARNVVSVIEALEAVEPEARAIIRKHVGDSTLGMAYWAERGSDFETEADLDAYMHEVAGRVGWLLTDLFSVRSDRIASRREEMMKTGQEFGLALQTVNVIRGLYGDRERGWIFMPRAFIETDIPPERLFLPENREIAVHALNRLVRKAEGHLDAARAYVRAIPRRYRGIRLFCQLPLFFAVRTLAISRTNARVFDEETKITRAEVGRIIVASKLFGWSNGWMDGYCRRLSTVDP